MATRMGGAMATLAWPCRGRSTESRVMVVVLALSLLTIPGCGYTTKEIYPKQYSTVAVPMFENRTFYRGVEFDLSEALVKEIQSRTPYKVVSPSVADTMLTGTITSIEQDTLSRTADAALPQQQEVSVRLDFEWKNLDTGRTLGSRQGFEAVGRYVPTRPVRQPLETARQRAVQTLADEIVSTMQVGLGDEPEPASTQPATQPADE